METKISKSAKITMKTKNVELVLSPPEPHFVGDGFRVHNFIPGGYRADMERMNPFILLDYGAKFYFSPTDSQRGVGVHPHRGFETVTIAYKGKVAHHDSAGHSGVIGEGDVQWMTAASGILHKEYHEKEFSKKGGDMQMVQLWVNLPARYKMSKPKYQSITNDQINKFELASEGGIVEVIAGEYKGTKGAASTFSPVNLFNVKMNNSGKADFSFPASYNTALLVLEGNAIVNKTEEVLTNQFALFQNDGEDFEVQSDNGAVILIMSGENLNEPIAAHGPFVMNSRQEILQAFDDYQKGKFGYLEA
jgi:redox-sensitive bicupin YhaK (pirin superfamily)